MIPCPNCDAPVSAVDEHRMTLIPAWTCTAHDWRAEAMRLRTLVGVARVARTAVGPAFWPALNKLWIVLDALLSDRVPGKENK